jgi:hypothetical protein
MLEIKLAAIFNLAFGVFHLFFWRLLDWKEQLRRVSEVNRAVIQTLNVCLTFMFLLVSYMCLFYTDEVRTTSIGKTLLIGMATFWLIRAALQIYYFNLKQRVHQVLLILFIAGIVIHVLGLTSD